VVVELLRVCRDRGLLVGSCRRLVCSLQGSAVLDHLRALVGGASLAAPDEAIENRVLPWDPHVSAEQRADKLSAAARTDIVSGGTVGHGMENRIEPARILDGLLEPYDVLAGGLRRLGLSRLRISRSARSDEDQREHRSRQEGEEAGLIDGVDVAELEAGHDPDIVYQLREEVGIGLEGNEDLGGRHLGRYVQLCSLPFCRLVGQPKER